MFNNCKTYTRASLAPSFSLWLDDSLPIILNYGQGMIFNFFKFKKIDFICPFNCNGHYKYNNKYNLINHIQINHIDNFTDCIIWILKLFYIIINQIKKNIINPNCWIDILGKTEKSPIKYLILKYDITNEKDFFKIELIKNKDLNVIKIGKNFLRKTTRSQNLEILNNNFNFKKINNFKEFLEYKFQINFEKCFRTKTLPTIENLR